VNEKRRMTSGASKYVRRSAVVALVLALSACGGDSTTNPPVAVITPVPTRGILAQTSVSNFESGTWVSLQVPLTQKGVLDVTVDWSFPSTWMYVYLGKTNCTYDQLAKGTCPFFLKSETKDPKPRVLYTDSLDPVTYYLFLYNRVRDPLTGEGSDNTETGSVQLGLTVYPFGKAPNGVTIGRTEIIAPPH
jgi:hypothetical protein